MQKQGQVATLFVKYVSVIDENVILTCKNDYNNND